MCVCGHRDCTRMYDAFEVSWSDPANVKAVMEHEVEQAKKLLCDNGYMVVERERVRYLSAGSSVTARELDCMSPDNRKDFMRYFYRRMFQEFVGPLEDLYREFVKERFDRWSDTFKHTVEIAVILPKQ